MDREPATTAPYCRPTLARPPAPVAAPPAHAEAHDTGPAVEADRVIPPSGNLWIGMQQIWLGPRGKDQARPGTKLREGLHPASCASVRSDVVGTSPTAIGPAEHRVGFGVGHDFPDLYRAAAGAGGLGSPLLCLLA
jgi:hypothetical protein